MIGSLISRGLLLIFGYAYPAYECYKSMEMNKSDIEQLRFWCQYWVLVAMLTVCERISDIFIGWVPMYGEAKLAFYIYLWFPKTKGTKYVYDSFFRPYIAKHEPEIDRSLLELRTRAGDLALLYWQKSASYIQTRIFDILQFIAAQSTPKRPAQPQPQCPEVQKPTAPPNLKAAATTPQAQNGPPSSPASSTSSSEHKENTTEEVVPSNGSKPATAPPISNELKMTPNQALIVSSKTLSSSEEQEMQIDSMPPPSVKESGPPPSVKETVAEEAGRLTRARCRKIHAAANR